MFFIEKYKFQTCSDFEMSYLIYLSLSLVSLSSYLLYVFIFRKYDKYIFFVFIFVLGWT